MAGTTEKTADPTAIRPFHVNVPDEALDDWAERADPKLIYLNEVDRGNHFVAWQEPELFSDQVRAAFRSLR
jgi:hypothetical protein